MGLFRAVKKCAKSLAHDGAEDAMIDCSAVLANISFINRMFGKGLR